MAAMHGLIMAVDDTSHNLELLRDLLENRGYKVIIEQDPRRAIEDVAHHQPDLVLLDIMMPHLDGFTFCERMKANPSTAHIPVIFISALHDTKDIVRGFDVGGVDYITKPFQQKEVMARVNSQMTLVHQRQEIAEQHQQSVAYFETLNTMKEQFIRSATHDLKNPLHIIAGYAALLEEMPPEEFAETGDQLVEGILNGTRRMQALIEEMLDLAQMETGSTQLSLDQIRAGDLLRHAYREYVAMAEQQGIRLELDVTEPDPNIFADISKMARAIENLVTNAIKYTAEGGEVWLRTDIDGDRVMLSIIDTGLGIPPDAIDSLFAPFFRVNAKDHRQREGTGLGLSIVKSIIEQHGGTITVESELGVGSTFRVILPIAS
jgi:two-component system, sensor histidine kinase and response regulator